MKYFSVINEKIGQFLINRTQKSQNPITQLKMAILRDVHKAITKKFGGDKNADKN